MSDKIYNYVDNNKILHVSNNNNILSNIPTSWGEINDQFITTGKWSQQENINCTNGFN